MPTTGELLDEIAIRARLDVQVPGVRVEPPPRSFKRVRWCAPVVDQVREQLHVNLGLGVAAALLLRPRPPEPFPLAELVPADAVVYAGFPDVRRLAEIPSLEDLAARLEPARSHLSGAAAVAPPEIEMAAATVSAPKRQAPIFDAVTAPEEEVAAEESQEVVVVMSTSGGRHFGVNVGEFASRYDAEKALLKTALAESATLNEGLRKTTQSGGAWRASFMGLTEEQAELACRRLSARAIPCETVGG